MKIIDKFKWLYYKARPMLLSKVNVRDGLGHVFTIETSNGHEVHRAQTFKEKEPETLDWIRRFGNFTNEPVFFDVGANIGIYSLYAASFYENIDIYSFEPDIQSCAALCRNVYMNNFRVNVYPVAISEGSGLEILHTSIMKAGAGASALGHDYLFHKNKSINTFRHGVFYVGIDDVVAKYNLPVPNFIKIDVDGLEEIILKNGATVFAHNDCYSVLVEIQYQSSIDIDRIIKFMRGVNFELSAKSEWICNVSGYSSQNFIFHKII